MDDEYERWRDGLSKEETLNYLYQYLDFDVIDDALKEAYTLEVKK